MLVLDAGAFVAIEHGSRDVVALVKRERLACRTDGASAPEFGELLGKGSALVVTASRGLQTRRRIQRIDVEYVAGAAIRENSLDSAAICAQFVDLGCEIHAPVQRHP